jgi:segregation and condensation protein A
MITEDPTLETGSFDGLPVRLEAFEGPLDLLVHLIRESKVDITDIPIAAITRQYLEYLELMRTLNLDIASEFLVMAATLVHIKSRMLLPVQEEEGVEEGEDPRRELVRQLLEYQRYKEAGVELRDLEESRSRVFTRGSLGPPEPPRTDFPLEVSLFELLSALKRLLEESPKTKELEIERERLNIAERISEILEFLKSAGEVSFDELFKERREVGDIVVTFLALLELLRLRLVSARQAEPFGTIALKAT